MGIPFYFKNLIQRYPHIISKPLIKECNRLFIDFNCVIHTCAAKLLSNPKFGPYQNTICPKEFQKKVISESLNYLSKITKQIRPTELLYIAVDGTCPRAKMQQQRKRRFMSAWRSKQLQLNSLTPNELWDSNIVTPGTQFMRDMDEALQEYVVHSNKDERLAYNVFASSSYEFGEGEHKIFDFIAEKKNESSIDVVYGLDADLILLGMIPDNQIVLLREVPEFNVRMQSIGSAEFLILNIDVLKRSIAREWLNNEMDRIKDYIILCSLLGNDFIPPLSFLKIKNDGIERVINIYNDIVNNNKNKIITYNNESNEFEININIIMNIIGRLSGIENEAIVEVDEKYYTSKYFGDNSPTSKLDSYPILNKFKRGLINVSQQSWRLKYYQHLFHAEESDIISRACENYLEGIQWIFNYYISKKQNNGWYYRYTYSPTCLDIYNYMIATPELSKKLLDKTLYTHHSHKEFVDAIENKNVHLLMVLPSSCSKYLPEPLSRIFHDISYGCVQFYPNIFDITLYLKTYLWECSAIIPDIKLDKILAACSQINQKK